MKEKLKLGILLQFFKWLDQAAIKYGCTMCLHSKNYKEFEIVKNQRCILQVSKSAVDFVSSLQVILSLLKFCSFALKSNILVKRNNGVVWV